MCQHKVGIVVLRDNTGKILNDSKTDILKKVSVKEYDTYFGLLSSFLYRNILRYLR